MMGRFLLVNWTSYDEIKGGCESIFNDLKNLLIDAGHEAKMITFRHANEVLAMGIERKKSMFFEVETSHLLDRYVSHYLKLYPKTNVISNAGLVNYWYKNKRTTNIFNDPFRLIVDVMARMALYGPADYNKYACILNLMQKESMNGAKNVAISDLTAYEMKRMGITPDITIPHGVDRKIFHPMDKMELREKYGIPKDATVAVWAKDFTPVAGFHILAKLIKEFKDIYWVLQFKNMRDYKPKYKNVKILQPIKRNIMPEIFNLGDFLVNPSIIESFGLVPLEAMACGIPCVVGNTGFIWDKKMEKDIEKKQYGIVVRNSSKVAYTKAINKLLEKKKEFRPREFTKKYDISIWRKAWTDLAEKLCAEKS